MMVLLFNFALHWVVLQQWLLPGKNPALECPSSAPCYRIQHDSMAVWEHIRPRLVVGWLPFWGELFLAQYHMPEGGMCLLRKDKLLFFMFGKLLLACQRGLYLVLVLFSQQDGKIVMMIWWEIYQGCFPRAVEDLVEVSFEFPALNLAASIFSGYSTSCSQTQARGVAAWTELIHSDLALVEFQPSWLFRYTAWYPKSCSPCSVESWLLLLPQWHVLCLNGPDVLRAEIQRAVAAVPSLSLICTGHVAYPQFKNLMGPKAMWALTLQEFHLLCSFPLKQQHQEPPKEMEQHHGVILFLIHFIYLFSTPNWPLGAFTVQQEHLKIILLEGHDYEKVSVIHCLY